MKKKQEYSIEPHGLSHKQKAKADKELVKLRLRSLSKVGKEEKIYADLISLKFKFTDYIQTENYSKEFSFSEFFKQYVAILNITKRKLAEDLSIHETRFSRILNDKENPGLAILYRIEEHCNGLISATLLWKIVNMKLSVEIENNSTERKKQARLVKNKLKLKSA
jgi:transcriptional regulator with XRE-family HTH domain